MGFLECLDDVGFIRKMKALDVDLEELPDVFEILDDGDGMLSGEEFILGMMKMAGKAQSKDMLKATKNMMRRQSVGTELLAVMDVCMDEEVEACDSSLHSASRSLTLAIMMTTEILNAMDNVGVNRVFKATLMQVPGSVELPNKAELVKKEKKRRLLEEEGWTPKLKANEVETPYETWIMDYYDQKNQDAIRAREKKAAREEEDKLIPVQEEAAVREGQDEDEKTLPTQESAGAPAAPATRLSKTGRMSFLEKRLDQDDSSDDEPTTAVSQFRDQWDLIGLGQAQWEADALRAAGDAGKEMLKPVLTVQRLNPCFSPPTSPLNVVEPQGEPAALRPAGEPVTLRLGKAGIRFEDSVV